MHEIRAGFNARAYAVRTAPCMKRAPGVNMNVDMLETRGTLNFHAIALGLVSGEPPGDLNPPVRRVLRDRLHPSLGEHPENKKQNGIGLRGR